MTTVVVRRTSALTGLAVAIRVYVEDTSAPVVVRSWKVATFAVQPGTHQLVFQIGARRSTRVSYALHAPSDDSTVNIYVSIATNQDAPHQISITEDRVDSATSGYFNNSLSIFVKRAMAAAFAVLFIIGELNGSNFGKMAGLVSLAAAGFLAVILFRNRSRQK